MLQYKSEETEFAKDRFEHLLIRQYEQICDPIYSAYESFDESIIVQAVEDIINGVNLDDSIDTITSYTNKKNIYSICQELYSQDFIRTIINLISDAKFDQYSYSIAKIVRNLWRKTQPSNDNIIFNDDLISVLFEYFNRDEIDPNVICIVFDAFYVLLSVLSDKLPMLLNGNIIDAINHFFFDENFDQRYCNGTLAFPFYLIYEIISISSPDSPYFSNFVEICLNHISRQYSAARVLSTQCIYNMCSKNQKLIPLYFSNPINIQTIIKSHYLNFNFQVKYLYALDTLLLQSEIEEIRENYINYDGFGFLKNLSKYVFNPSFCKIPDEIKYVLLFLYNTMDLFWTFLVDPSLYNSSDEIPIIYRIIDISNNSTYKERNLSGNCISRFILLSNFNYKIQIGHDGGFDTLSMLVQNGDVKSQYVILCALKDLLQVSKSFLNEAHQCDLQNILSQMEFDDDDCNILVTDILSCIKP